MRRAILAAAISLAAVPAAQAQELEQSDQRLDIFAQALPACVLNSPTGGEGSNAVFTATSATAGQIDIVQLVDPSTATSLASSMRVDLPVVCNASHRVLLRSNNGGLLRTGAGVNQRGGSGFAEFLPYRIALNWAGQTLDRSSDQGDAQIIAGRPATGMVEIRVSTASNQGPLIAGQYSDSIILEFQPGT